MDPKQLRSIIQEEVTGALNVGLAPIKKTLNEHTKILNEHTKILGEHTKTLGEHTKILGEHSDKLDSITGELYQVHQLVDTTLDIVKGRYEKNKAEIDEIKDHLGLPKKPYF